MAEYSVALEGGGNAIGTSVSGQLATHVTGEMTLTPAPTDVKVTGDPTKPVSSTLEVLNLPRLTLHDIKDILTPQIRMHVPNYQQMSFKVMGFELFSWCLSGETQVITQPYVSNRYEEDKIECPDEDTRPFPDKTPMHGTPLRSARKTPEQ